MQNIDMAKDGQDGEDHLQYVVNNIESAERSLSSKIITGELEAEHKLVSNFRRSTSSRSFRENLFLHCNHHLHNKIPKHIITIDEKYILGYVELFSRCRLSEAACNFASEVDTLSDYLTSKTETNCASSHDQITRLFIECPFPAEMKNVLESSTNEWMNSTVSGNKSMVNILKSPLFQQFRPIESKADHGRSLLEISEADCSEYVNMHGYAATPVQKRIVSASSTSSICSDHSSSSTSVTLSKGMLQCTWKNGLPRYVFSVDNNKEVYVANAFKVESPNNKGSDYVYTFHSTKNVSKERDILELGPEIVGNMRVSASTTFCSNNAEIMETRFILFGFDDTSVEEMKHESCGWQKKRLTRKVSDVFRSSRSHKQRSSSKLGGTVANVEDLSPVEAYIENQDVPNLELAAIISRRQICTNKEAEIGGWGLKFLKKSRNNASVYLEHCPQNCEECSASVNVIIPAGVHGGPRTGIGGPSSLTERWISGGHCDCGGWDIGCPLTVLNTRSCPTEALLDNSGECKSFDLFIQGSRQNAAIMEMVNIHEGLYYIQFQSNLSSLQSFAIATSLIDSHSPNLLS